MARKIPPSSHGKCHRKCPYFLWTFPYKDNDDEAEVEIVHAVSAGGSVKFLPAV